MLLDVIIFFFFLSQLVTVICTPVRVYSTWSCINCLEAIVAVSVSTVDTIQRDDTAITARKAFTRTLPRISHIVECADVSHYFNMKA